MRPIPTDPAQNPGVWAIARVSVRSPDAPGAKNPTDADPTGRCTDVRIAVPRGDFERYPTTYWLVNSRASPA